MEVAQIDEGLDWFFADQLKDPKRLSTSMPRNNVLCEREGVHSFRFSPSAQHRYSKMTRDSDSICYASGA